LREWTKQQNPYADNARAESRPQHGSRALLDQHTQHGQAQAIPHQVLRIGMHEVTGQDAPDFTPGNVRGTEI